MSMDQIKKLLKSTEPVRWLFYGDSITHGAKHTNGRRDFSEHFRERVVWELQRKNDLVLNSAFSGFKASDLLRDFDFRAQAFMPHAAFILIGSNDSVDVEIDTFGAQLEELVGKFEAINCRCILQTPLPVLRDLDTKRLRTPELAEKVRFVADKYELPLIDHFESWKNDSADFYLHADALHPNGEGHIKIAHDIFKALGIFEQTNSRVCNFFTPKML